jgi:NifU-like protein involved in Fe-S cluster formation
VASATALYTPDVLRLATGLAAWPLEPDLPFTGRARSQSCGSTLAMGLALDGTDRIARIGLAAQACAIGQAAAAIFAADAVGHDRAAIVAGEAAVRAWLSDDGPLPDWPGLTAIARASAYPARHGAILLPWRAALDALPLGPAPR